MKRIIKRQPPQELIAWTHGKKTNEDGSAASWNYDSMEAPLKDIVRKNLVDEQGGLCCYTGVRITKDTSHIEHLKPQEKCENHEDTEYFNLLAAHPGPNQEKACRFGAVYKDNWYIPELFVDPFRPDCELRFRYKDKGDVVPVRADDGAAEETIKRLNLNDKDLVLRRKQAITGWLDDDLTKGEVARILARMDSKIDGMYHEFCFVIKQAGERYLKRFA